MTDTSPKDPPRDQYDWGPPKDRPASLEIDELNAWSEATEGMRALAKQRKLSKAEVARRSSIPAGTLTPWYDGTYPGNIPNVTEKARKWLKAEAEKAKQSALMLREPDFVETRTALEMLQILRYAQSAPAMAVITLGPGMGKTTTARYFADNTPHAHRVVMRPSTGAVGAMLRELAASLGVLETSKARLTRAIGEKLKRNGRHTLLMIDEAQNLCDNAVNELRHYLDEYGTGIALLGNEDVHQRFGGSSPREGFGQVHRRVGMRLRRLTPLAGDIDAYVEAWGIDDPDVLKLARTIGRKPGALGQIAESLKLAAIVAAGRGRSITAEDLRDAWINRGGEELRS